VNTSKQHSKTISSGFFIWACICEMQIPTALFTLQQSPQQVLHFAVGVHPCCILGILSPIFIPTDSFRPPRAPLATSQAPPPASPPPSCRRPRGITAAQIDLPRPRGVRGGARRRFWRRGGVLCGGIWRSTGELVR
jgi:hypothetical protein